MRWTELLLTLSLLAAPSVAGAADPVDSRAAELAKLRREVEALSADVQLRKEDTRTRLKAVEAQNLEIGVQIRREELRLAQVAGEAEARKAELAAHAATSQALVEPLLASIATIRETVQGGLPFRLADRLAELDKLEEQLRNGLLTPEAGTARLWAFTEDELRLTRENGLDRQTVPLPTGEVLADVARIGMVAMYFRTDGGVVGAAQRSGDAWTWRAFTSRDDEVAVEQLFEKMKHGVRTGSFVLPNPEGAP